MFGSNGEMQQYRLLEIERHLQYLQVPPSLFTLDTHRASTRHHDAGNWLSFLNLPVFLRSLHNPQERLRLQPSFILSALALSILMQSSELEGKHHGRNQAVDLRNRAHEAVQARRIQNYLDEGLAEAALVGVPDSGKVACLPTPSSWPSSNNPFILNMTQLA